MNIDARFIIFDLFPRAYGLIKFPAFPAFIKFRKILKKENKKITTMPRLM